MRSARAEGLWIVRAVNIVALVLICCVLSQLALPTHSRAASRLTENFADLVKLADAIVEVEITKTEAGPPIAGIPMSVASVTINRVHKGDIDQASITIEYIGGGDLIAPGQPQLSARDKALILIRKPIPGSPHWRIIGGDAGHILLLHDHSGNAIARRASGTFDFFVDDPQSVTGLKEVKAPVITMDRLSELMQVILTTGRPVLEKSSTESTSTHPPPDNSPPAQLSAAVAPESSFIGRIAIIIAIISGGWLLRRQLNLRAAK